ncbi:MAG: hypothetical protein K2J10_04955 [Muribaculaceae bacterium]|nr:hypothetical protein [Muribaculaceae bacterium]
MKILGTMMVLIFLSSCEGNKSELYLRDKYHIEQAFLDNVETIRRELLWHPDGFTYNSVFEDLPDSLNIYSSSIFGGRAFYWDYDRKKFFTVPRPANEWLEVEVGSISYSADSLKCVALVTVRDKSPNFTNRKGGINYDGYAIIGLRDSKDKSFKIYPEGFMAVLDYPFKFEAMWDLKRYYNNLRGNYTPQSDVKYSYGINDPRFFETAHEFSWIDSLGMYWCETNLVRGRRVPYIFYSNQDSTIDKHLFVE